MNDSFPYVPPKTKVDIYISTRKRSFWRALVFGFLSKWVVILLYIGISYILTPMIWPILYGVRYTAPKGPMVPGTNEWLILQAVGVISALVCGYASAYWSKPGSMRATIVLVIIFLVLTLFYLYKNETSLILSIWYFYTPIGVAIGAVLFKYRVRET